MEHMGTQKLLSHMTKGIDGKHLHCLDLSTVYSFLEAVLEAC